MSSRAHLRGTTLLYAMAILGPSPVQFPSLKLPSRIFQKYLEQVRELIPSKRLRSAMLMALIPMLFIAPATRVFGSIGNQSAVHATSQTPAAKVISANDALALKGINIGNDQSSTQNQPYQTVENEADLAYLKGKVSRIRIALAYGLDANDVRNLKKLAVEAKNYGFYVQFGITAGADADTSIYYNQWISTGIIRAAEWAQANHIDEFTIGNEEDWYCQALGAFTAKTPKEIRDDIRSEVTRVRSVYTGSIVFSDAEGALDDWIKEGIGGLDRIYFNAYDTLPNFQTIITKIVNSFGTNHGGIAEWSAEHDYNDMIQSGMSPEQYAQEIMNRATIIRNSRLPAYMFTLRMDPNGNNWGFILGDSTKRPGLDEFLALK